MGEGPITRIRRKRLRPFVAVRRGSGAVRGRGHRGHGGEREQGTTLASGSRPSTPDITSGGRPRHSLQAHRTSTPIKHLVVIFDENVSFDHYFGTYPYAANTDGTAFYAKPGTPTVNGLYTKITRTGPVGSLLTNQPDTGYNPQRLTTPRP